MAQQVVTRGYLGNEFEIDTIEAGKIHLKLDNVTLVRSVTGQLSAPAGSAAGAVAGDVKAGIQATDHNNWYLLNGRAKTTLPASAQVAATLLGIGVNLPNAAGRLLKQGALLAVGGAATVTLTRINLPDITLVSSTTAAHTHTTGGAIAGGITHVATGQPANGEYGLAQRSASGNNTTTAVDANAGELNITGGQQNHSHTTSAQGLHAHSAPLGGTNTPVTIDPPWLGVNWFVYLP